MSHIISISMSDSNGIEALLTYAPLTDISSPKEVNSGCLQDLYACTETAQFFTILQARVTIEQRSSRSAKQFFCPCCPKSALNIAFQPNGDTLITCPSCGWDARRTGVTTVSELLERDGDPYPWISDEIRSLARTAEAHFHRDADTRDDSQPDLSVISPSLSASRTNSARLLRRRASLRSIPGNSPTQQLQEMSSPADNAKRFTREQEEKEARVFARWMPESPTLIAANLHGKPDGDMSDLLGAINLDDLIELEDRVCSATWWKRDMAARRRVPRPRIIIRSPFSQQLIACKAERIVPNFHVRLRDKCDMASRHDESLAQLVLNVQNRFADAQLEICVTNARAAEQYAKATLPGGSNAKLLLRPFSFHNDCMTADIVHREWMCGQLATLDMRIQYSGNLPEEDKAIGERPWQLRIYARHTKADAVKYLPTKILAGEDDLGRLPQRHVLGAGGAR